MTKQSTPQSPPTTTAMVVDNNKIGEKDPGRVQPQSKFGPLIAAIFFSSATIISAISLFVHHDYLYGSICIVLAFFCFTGIYLIRSGIGRGSFAFACAYAVIQFVVLIGTIIFVVLVNCDFLSNNQEPVTPETCRSRKAWMSIPIVAGFIFVIIIAQKLRSKGHEV